MFRLSTLRKYDWFLTVLIFILLMLGLAAVYSVDLSKGDSLIYFPTQVIAIVLGMTAYGVASSIHYTRYESGARLMYIGALLLLVAVLFLGVTVSGTRGWFRLAGFSFQPAEFAKVALVVLLGWLISKQGRRYDSWQFVLSSGLATAFLGGLILLQPDLGSAAILFLVWTALLFLTGTKKRYLVGLIALYVVMLVLGWFFFFADYQRGRFQAFLDPEGSEYGYNIRQSIIAIGSGNLFGRGLGFGSQSQLHFLPEAQTDFILAVIGEELGLVGVLMLLILYILLFWRLSKIAREAHNDFAAYTVIGIAALFAVQALINIGGASGLLPITGVPLPFISYGGSSLIMNLFLLGIAQSIARERRLSAQNFAF